MHRGFNPAENRRQWALGPRPLPDPVVHPEGAAGDDSVRVNGHKHRNPKRQRGKDLRRGSSLAYASGYDLCSFDSLAYASGYDLCSFDSLAYASGYDLRGSPDAARGTTAENRRQWAHGPRPTRRLTRRDGPPATVVRRPLGLGTLGLVIRRRSRV